MTIPVSALQAVAPGSIIELFELELVAALHGSAFTYRFHGGTNALSSNGNIVWAGNTYAALPIEASGFEYNGQGQLPRPTIRTSNLLGSITAVLLNVNTTTPGNDLTGAKLTRIRTLARYIDAANFPGSVNPYGTPDPTVKFPDEIFYVSRKVSETRDLVEFELAAAFDLAGIRSPKRQCIANLCQWVYRSAECTYSGPPVADENDKPLPGVQASPLGAVYKAAESAFNSSAAVLETRTAELATARNNLNSAQEYWYRAETRYNFGSYADPIKYYVSPPNSYVYQTVAYWNGVQVSLGQTYRQGAERFRLGYGVYHEIERWVVDSSNVTNAQAAYAVAAANYSTALADYSTKLAAKDSAFDAWQTSPQYVGDLNASGDVCGKRLSSCQIRFGPRAPLPFGSFPGIGTFNG